MLFVTVKAECTLTAGKKTFRQRGDIVVSNGYPRITVSPIEKLLQCGNAATLTCSVQDPYKVNFKDFGTDPAKGKLKTHRASLCSNVILYVTFLASK